MTGDAICTVFNIVHDSFVDGPGIRTTVFLKGCPLHCLWCCNPEGQRSAPEVRLIGTGCNGCGRCVTVCPQGSLRLASNLPAVDRRLCSGCGACAELCPTGALEMFGTVMTARSV